MFGRTTRLPASIVKPWKPRQESRSRIRLEWSSPKPVPVETGFDAAIARNDLIAEFYRVITKGVPILPSSAA
jgi:hypothetical protein